MVLLVGCYDLKLNPYMGVDGGQHDAGNPDAVDAPAGTGGSAQSAGGSAGTQQTGGQLAGGGSTGIAGGSGQGGAIGLGGTTGSGGSSSGVGGATGATSSTTGSGGSGLGGTTGTGGSGLGGSGGSVISGGTSGSGGTAGKSTTAGSGGTSSSGGVTAKGGSSAAGGSGGRAGSSAAGGSSGTSSCGAAAGSGPVGVFNGPLATGIAFKDTDGNPVNTHGGGIIQVCDTFYMHGLYFPPGPTPDDFHGVSMYSSKDLANWKKEGSGANGIVFPTQASGELGPNRNCDRPHIIKCPKTGEFILTARASDLTFQADKEVVYATSPTVNGQYSYKGILKNASGQSASHSDMSAYADETGAYFVTESGWVYPLADDCHSWVSGKQYSAVNGTSGGGEAPTLFRVGSTYYWIASYKTGWRCNNNFYSTAPAMTGPWTYQGFVAPVEDTSNDISLQRTWLSQTTWVQPVVGSKGTVYVYWGDHWDKCGATSGAGADNSLTTFVFQPLVLDGTSKTLLPTYLATWSLDVGAGTWSSP
jgi:Type IV secretory pathway, TrbL components